MKTLGAKRIMFCSPQPNGIWSSFSSPSMVWVRKLPVTARYARPESGTTCRRSGSKQTEGADCPAGRTRFSTFSRLTPSGSTIMLLITASARLGTARRHLQLLGAELVGPDAESALPTSPPAT